MSDLRILLPEFRRGDGRGVYGIDGPSIRHCEWRIDTFVRRDAYPKYDRIGQSTPNHTITQDHLSALNTAMRGRSSYQAWESFLEEPLPELADVPANLDLIDSGEAEVARGLEALDRVTRRITSLRGLTDMGVSKVLHLLRPHFIAISDSHVRERLLLREEIMQGTLKPDSCARRLREVERAVREVGLHNSEALLALSIWANSLSLGDGTKVTLSKARILVPAIGKERYNQPLVVSLSNHERLTLRQAQGERYWAGLCDADLGY